MTEKEDEFFSRKVGELLAMPEIQRLSGFIQHADVNRLEHSVYVAYSSYCICRRLRLKVDYDSLIRGAMLHDYFLYEWKDVAVSPRWHGLKHPAIACENAGRLFRLNRVERDIISCHMWPLTFRHIPRHRESVVVCLADKICATMEAVRHPVFRPKFMGSL